MAKRIASSTRALVGMLSVFTLLIGKQLCMPVTAAAHELDEDFADGCCTAHYVACEARPGHAYLPCRRGRRGVDVSANFSFDCIGVGCIGPTGECAPLLSDATCVDDDGDALLSSWETTGYDANSDGTVDVNLASLGANASRKDVFVEVDCIVSDANGDGDLNDAVDHSHCPRENALRDVVQGFADAPVANVDGTTGIQLHIDVGPLFGAGVITQVNGAGGVTGTYGDLGGGGTQIAEAGNQVIDWDGATGRAGVQFSTLRAANFNANRAELFRYTIFGHQCNARRAVNDCTSGWAEDLGCNDFMVTLGGVSPSGTSCWGVDANGFSVGSRADQAGTLMHELGHCLGLDHGGSEDVNDKPHYLSVMNYSFQGCSVPSSPTLPAQFPGGCDYSRTVLPPVTGQLDELSLDECLGIDNNALGFGPVDWDGDTQLEGVSLCSPGNGSNVSADINGDDVCVARGANLALDTSPSGDDVIAGGVIRDGANRTCNTTAQGDDEQRVAVGTVQPNPLSGFDDWLNILYGFQGLPSFTTGVSSPVENEPDPEIIARSRAELAERMRPIVGVQLSAPATVLPGEALTFAVTFQNPGRGPGLDLQAVQTDPAGISSLFGLSVLQAHQTANASIVYNVPADACPQQLTSNVAVSYQDFVGNTLSTSGAASAEVLDVVPPEIQCNAAPFRPSNTPVSFTSTATDHCSTPTVFISGHRCYRVNGSGKIIDHTHSCRVEHDGTRVDIRNSGGVGMVIAWTVVATDAWNNQSTVECSVEVVR